MPTFDDLTKHLSADPLIGIPTIARLLDCAQSTATLLAARGRFPTVAIDGRVFARRSDVVQFARERTAAKRPGAKRSA